MNNHLALEILNVLKKGESNGYQTIKNDIQEMKSFYEVSDTDFKIVFDKLEELKCIIQFRNITQNNVRCYKLNIEKDCIELYSNKLMKGNPEKETTIIPTIGNSTKFGDNFSGVFIQGSDSINSPINNNVTHTPNIKPATATVTGLWRFMNNPIVKFILAIVGAIIAAYFIFIFKWNK